MVSRMVRRYRRNATCNMNGKSSNWYFVPARFWQTQNKTAPNGSLLSRRTPWMR